MATPPSVYDYDVRTRELTLLRRTPVLGGFDPADYEEHRLWATAADGERVPISLVCRAARAGTAAGPPGPAAALRLRLLRDSIDPYFSIPRLSLLDRGAAFAIAHVRGGGEMGRRWYDEGKLRASRTRSPTSSPAPGTSSTTGWTTPDRLVAEGGSAGGLLMGAVANLAPEVFAGIVAGVPFVDA